MKYRKIAINKIANSAVLITIEAFKMSKRSESGFARFMKKKATGIANMQASEINSFFNGFDSIMSVKKTMNMISSVIAKKVFIVSMNIVIERPFK